MRIIFFLTLSLLSSVSLAESKIDQSCQRLLLAPRLTVISAPSGAGKTTLVNMLMQKYPERFVVAISTTTRAPRPGEIDGKDYFFTDRMDFQRRMKSGDFIEWAEVHGNFYGTAKAQIQDALAQGKNMILNIDVQGAENLRKVLPGEPIRTVFIAPPSIEELERRLRARGTESEESLQIRLAAAKDEMAEAKRYDFTVVNDDLAEAFARLEKILQD